METTFGEDVSDNEGQLTIFKRVLFDLSIVFKIQTQTLIRSTRMRIVAHRTFKKFTASSITNIRISLCFALYFALCFALCFDLCRLISAISRKYTFIIYISIDLLLATRVVKQTAQRTITAHAAVRLFEAGTCQTHFHEGFASSHTSVQASGIFTSS